MQPLSLAGKVGTEDAPLLRNSTVEASYRSWNAKLNQPPAILLNSAKTDMPSLRRCSTRAGQCVHSSIVYNGVSQGMSAGCVWPWCQPKDEGEEHTWAFLRYTDHAKLKGQARRTISASEARRASAFPAQADFRADADFLPVCHLLPASSSAPYCTTVCVSLHEGSRSRASKEGACKVPKMDSAIHSWEL